MAKANSARTRSRGGGHVRGLKRRTRTKTVGVRRGRKHFRRNFAPQRPETPRKTSLWIRNPLLYPAELRAQIFWQSFTYIRSALSRLIC